MDIKPPKIIFDFSIYDIVKGVRNLRSEMSRLLSDLSEFDRI